MFTSRAEFRLALRPDNADLRLTEKAFFVGCVSPSRYARCVETRSALDNTIAELKAINNTLNSWRKIFSLSTTKSCSHRK